MKSFKMADCLLNHVIKGKAGKLGTKLRVLSRFYQIIDYPEDSLLDHFDQIQ